MAVFVVVGREAISASIIFAIDMCPWPLTSHRPHQSMCRTRLSLICRGHFRFKPSRLPLFGILEMGRVHLTQTASTSKCHRSRNGNAQCSLLADTAANLQPAKHHRCWGFGSVMIANNIRTTIPQTDFPWPTQTHRISLWLLSVLPLGVCKYVYMCMYVCFESKCRYMSTPWWRAWGNLLLKY